MFLAKPLRFRADLVCARSYAGKGAVLRSGAFFCALLTLRARSTREFRRANPPCDPAAGLWTPLPAIPFLFCPSNQSSASARCSLDLRVRSMSHIYVAVDSWRGASRPPRRARAGLGEEREPACHLRPQHVCLHLAHPSMYGTTCPYLPFGCRPSRQCVVSMRRTSCSFLTHTAPPARRGRRIHAVRELWQGNRPARTKMPFCWQDVADMRSPGARRWQNAREMRSQRPMVAGLRPDAFLA